jgi:ATP-binding protein involved in chromosome partitioning
MSWFQPEQTGKKYYVFGKDGGKQLAEEYSLELLAQLPLVVMEDNSKIQDDPILKSEFAKISVQLMDSVNNLKEKRSTGIPQINIIK